MTMRGGINRCIPCSLRQWRYESAEIMISSWSTKDRLAFPPYLTKEGWGVLLVYPGHSQRSLFMAS